MSKEQPKPVPRKPRVRTKSEPDSQLSDVHGELEQKFTQLDIGPTSAEMEMQRLSVQVAELRQEEQRLRAIVSQLQHQQFTLQEEKVGQGWYEDTLKKRERELIEREERFRSEASDKDYKLKNRELELQRLEDELNGRKKEMALARFDEDQEAVSHAQLAKLTDKEVHLQKQEERLQQKEFELSDWALRLDQQAKELNQRMDLVKQREANAPPTSTSTFPVPGHTHPHPQWVGEAPRPQIYTSSVPNMSNYYPGSEQPPPVEGYRAPSHQWYPPDSPQRTTGYPPYTANQGTGILGPNPASQAPGLLGPNPASQGPGILGATPVAPGYHHTHQHHQQPHPLQIPAPQYQNQPPYQHQHSPYSSPEVTRMAHPSQVHPSQGHHSPTQIPCGQVTDVSSHSGQPLPPTLNVPGAEGRSLSTERIVFSVGGEVGSERNMRGSSTSMASAVGGDISGREGGGTLPQTSGYSKTIDKNEERARALQWEEQKKAEDQEIDDLEMARRLQEQFDAEARSTQQYADSTDQLLAWQLQHEDLKDELGSDLTHGNQLMGEGGGPEVTEVVKKALDERMTRQHQLKEQEEADRRIAENISETNLGEPAVQTNLRNNLSS